jgi:hypothetical protein
MLHAHMHFRNVYSFVLFRILIKQEGEELKTLVLLLDRGLKNCDFLTWFKLKKYYL